MGKKLSSMRSALLISALWSMRVMASGIFQPGDLIEADTEVVNMSDQDGDLITLLPLYSPRTYELLFDANGGKLPSGEEQVVMEVVYNDGRRIFDPQNTNGDHMKANEDMITVPEDPVREDHDFLGWYLKGNGMPEAPGPLDGTLISDGSRYMIANEDQEAFSQTLHTYDRAMAVALWQPRSLDIDDGDQADEGFEGPDTVPGGGSGDETPGLWDEQNVNNHVIEYITGIQDKASYEKIYGDIGDQYRRIYLSAETEHALGYSWFRKVEGEADYSRLAETSGLLLLDQLTRADDKTRYMCEVSMGENGEKLSFETEISVHWLPRLGDPHILIKVSG